MKLTCFLFILFSLIPNYLAGGEQHNGTIIYRQSVNGYKVSVELLTREGGDLRFTLLIWITMDMRSWLL